MTASVYKDDFDENNRQQDANAPGDNEETIGHRAPSSAHPQEEPPSSSPQLNEIQLMAVNDAMLELTELEEFAGVALFAPNGEIMAMLNDNTASFNLKRLGVLANNVLLNAKKTAQDNHIGCCEQVHLETDSQVNILVRCLNEGRHTSPIQVDPGKAHIHLVLALKGGENLYHAKKRLDATIKRLAPDCRI